MVFTVETLERGIEKCKQNIKIFEEAIEKENQSMREFRQMARQIEEKEDMKKEIASHVEIEVEN